MNTSCGGCGTSSSSHMMWTQLSPSQFPMQGSLAMASPYFRVQLRLSCPWKPQTLHVPALGETSHDRLSCPSSPHQEQVRVPVALIVLPYLSKPLAVVGTLRTDSPRVRRIANVCRSVSLG